MTSTVAFVGGRVLTMTSTPAEVVVVADGRIAAAGDRSVLERHPDAEITDLEARILCPGFIDAHTHLSIAALHPEWSDLSEAATMHQIGAELNATALRHPEAEWVRGAGWTEIGTGLVPHRRDLDALGIDRPVIVAHYSLHQCVVSSRGLDELGIGRGTPDPPGGEIGRDPNGEPNGLLVERAWSEAHALSLRPYQDPDRRADHIEARARSLLADGITCVHDAACSPAGESAYQALASAGRLPLSVLAMPHPEAILSPPDTSRLAGAPTGEGDELFRVGPIKLFADGGVTPAIDVHMGGSPLTVGTVFDGLPEQIAAAVERGFSVAVHAIGNAGLAAALQSFAVAARSDSRLRVEHACLASPEQMRDMAALGATAVVQPGFVHHLGAMVEGVHFDDAEWLPFGALARSGVALAASSDDPCALHEPLRTSALGATRRTGAGGVLDISQALSYEQWLRAYTAGAADAGAQEHERGRIAPGLRADLVVLDGELDPANPPSVAQTWVGGELTFSASATGRAG